jgi:hypothetical protein
MIGVSLAGGLGNQMFQYAFAYSNAKRNQTWFFLLKEGMPIELYKYFELERNLFYSIDRTFFDTPICKMLFSHYLRNLFYNAVKRIATANKAHIGNEQEPDNTVFTKDNTLYAGFFQSPVYFEDYAADIRRLFKPKKRIVDSYKAKYNWLAAKTVVAVHIRKTDYADLAHLNLGKKDLSLPISYFKKIIDETYDERYQYVFVSDDIEQIKPHFSYLKTAFFSDDSAINDFLHLYYADKLIIANSTFSWWAAYLNNKPQKVVYCPKYFLGYAIKEEHPKSIYPKDWVQVEVEDDDKPVY